MIKKSSQESLFMAEKLLADLLCKPELLVFLLYLREAGGRATKQKADLAFGIDSKLKLSIWNELIKYAVVSQANSGFKITPLGNKVVSLFSEYVELIDRETIKESITNATKDVQYKGINLINCIQISASSSFVWTTRTSTSQSEIILVNPNSDKTPQTHNSLVAQQTSTSATSLQSPDRLELKNA